MSRTKAFRRSAQFRQKVGEFVKPRSGLSKPVRFLPPCFHSVHAFGKGFALSQMGNHFREPAMMPSQRRHIQRLPFNPCQAFPQEGVSDDAEKARHKGDDEAGDEKPVKQTAFHPPTDVATDGEGAKQTQVDMQPKPTLQVAEGQAVKRRQPSGRDKDASPHGVERQESHQPSGDPTEPDAVITAGTGRHHRDITQVALPKPPSPRCRCE
jgi:hypothetical protein